MELTDWLVVEIMADSQQNPLALDRPARLRRTANAARPGLKLNRAVIVGRVAGQMRVITLELCNTTDWITKVRRPNGAVASNQANTLEFDDIRLDTHRYSCSWGNGCRPLFWA
jgi:hypothetical protein